MKKEIDWKKVFTIGGIVATIIGAGFNMADGFFDLKTEAEKTKKLPGPSDEESE